MNEDSNFIQLLVTELSKLIKLAVEKLSDPVTKSGVSGNSFAFFSKSSVFSPIDLLPKLL